MARNGAAPTNADSAVDESADQDPLATADPADDVDLIRDQLREKDQLVAALTERLEQAAEQLDRLRRTGADKGGRRPQGGGGLPPELVDDHKTTLEDLKRVITNWENIQAGASLGRIETQIAELRDLLVTSSHHRGPVASGGSHASPARERPAETSAAPAKSAEPAAPRPAGKAGGNAWWEAQKAALIGEAVPAEVQPPPPPVAESESESESVRQSSPTADGGAFDLAGLTVPDLPEPVDFEQMTLDDARVAIRERDRLLDQLREPLLFWKTAGQLPPGLASVADVPAALKDCITQLEAQWQAKFRQAELDLSLERARLARENNAVKQQQDVIQKGPKAGGPSGKGGRGAEGGGADDDSASRRRWFRFMGSPEDGDADETHAKK
jgi:hypothetical protein